MFSNFTEREFESRTGQKSVNKPERENCYRTAVSQQLFGDRGDALSYSSQDKRIARNELASFESGERFGLKDIAKVSDVDEEQNHHQGTPCDFGRGASITYGSSHLADDRTRGFYATPDKTGTDSQLSSIHKYHQRKPLPDDRSSQRNLTSTPTTSTHNSHIQSVGKRIDYMTNYLLTCNKIAISDHSVKISTDSELKLFTEDEFMPPFESFMDLNDVHLQRQRFLNEVRMGDVFCCTITSITENGMHLVLLCYACDKIRQINHLKINAYCSARDVPELLSGQSRELADVYTIKDYVRGVAVNYSTSSEKLKISLLQHHLPKYLEGKINLGLVRHEDLPSSFKTQCESGNKTFHQMLNGHSLFRSPGSVSRLCSILNLPTDPRSSLFTAVSRLEIAEEEKATSIRKHQSRVQALQCVVKGVKLYKEGNHIEPLALYNKALDIDEENVEAYVARGAFYANNESYSRALDDFTQALKFNPKHQNATDYLVQTLLAYARDLEDTDNKEGALRCYKRILSVNSEHALALQHVNRLSAFANNLSADQEPVISSTRPDSSSPYKRVKTPPFLHGSELSHTFKTPEDLSPASSYHRKQSYKDARLFDNQVTEADSKVNAIKSFKAEEVSKSSIGETVNTFLPYCLLTDPAAKNEKVLSHKEQPGTPDRRRSKEKHHRRKSDEKYLQKHYSRSGSNSEEKQGRRRSLVKGQSKSKSRSRSRSMEKKQRRNSTQFEAEVRYRSVSGKPISRKSDVKQSKDKRHSLSASLEKTFTKESTEVYSKDYKRKSTEKRQFSRSRSKSVDVKDKQLSRLKHSDPTTDGSSLHRSEAKKEQGERKATFTEKVKQSNTNKDSKVSNVKKLQEMEEFLKMLKQKKDSTQK